MKTQVVSKGNIRAYFADATDVSQIAMDKHETLPMASLALSTAISVFSSVGLMNEQDKLSLVLNGDGPLGTIMVDVSHGFVRAFIANPQVVTDEDNKNFNLIPIEIGIGTKGTLKVISTLNKHIFKGETKIVKGDITTDIAFYFDQSAQIRTAVLSSVILDSPKKLKHAYSAIFQMLPGHTKNDIEFVENFIKNNKLSNKTLEDFIMSFDGNHLETINTTWKCTCSREKSLETLNLLADIEKDEIIKKHGKLEVQCNFCRTKYTF